MRAYKCDGGTPAAFTAAMDFIECTPADDKPCIFLRLSCFQTTDFGDAAAEVLRTSVVRGNTTSGSGGVAAANGNPCSPSDATSGFTYEALNSTVASTGTPKAMAGPGWNVQLPLDHIYLPEERDEVGQGNTLMCWRLPVAPADSLTIGMCVTVGENG